MNPELRARCVQVQRVFAHHKKQRSIKLKSSACSLSLHIYSFASHSVSAPGPTFPGQGRLMVWSPASRAAEWKLDSVDRLGFTTSVRELRAGS